MGWFSSDEETNEEKVIDSSGQVSNNIIIQEARDTHHQAIISEKLLFATYTLIGLEIIKVIICSYGMWKRQLKKRYAEKTVKQTDNV